MVNDDRSSPIPPRHRRSRYLRPIVLGLVAGAVSGPLVPRALADYGPGAEAASANGARLGDRGSTRPSISDDGRYVIFATAASTLLGAPPDPADAYTAGLVRRDMLTGAVELVAPPERRRRSDGEVLSPGVTIAGSISGSGRYVLFETPVALTGGDLNSATDVYVRDMTRPVTDVGAYELVSAQDGTTLAPVYAHPAAGSRAGQVGFSLSDDGRTAVFVTQGASNLPSGGAATTPAAQVFARRLDTRRTVLVTRAAADPTLPGTPAGAGAGGAPAPPALSGDGGTVVWGDANAGAQAPLLPGERAPRLAYLWRRIADGPRAATRRVAGAGDPEDPACPAGSVLADNAAVTGPCYGPFVEDAAIGASGDPGPLPLSISDDGRRVLFLSSAQRRALNLVDQREKAMYLADLGPGLTRKRGVVLRLSVPDGAAPAVGEAVLSGDGRRVAFTSANRQFDGARPIGTFQTGELTATNAFVLDLDADTVQRATVGADGGDFRGGVVAGTGSSTPTDPGLRSVAIDDGGTAIAFGAADGNLFPGDANDASDVQVVRGSPGLAAAPGTAAAAAPAASADAAAVAQGALSVLRAVHPVIGYATLGARGVATVTVRVPAAGRLTAEAKAPSGGRRVLVATVRRTPKRAATLRLRLVPSAKAKRALRTHKRLAVSVSIRFVPTAGASTTVARRYALTRAAVR